MSHCTTGNSKTPSQKQLNPNVARYLRCIKRAKEAFGATPKTEVAEICGVSRKYLQRNSGLIEAYYLQAPEADEADLRWYGNRHLQAFIRTADGPRSELGAIVGWLLRYRYGLLGHLRKRSAIIEAGGDVLSIATQCKARKSGKGAPIHSKSKAVQRLTAHSKVALVDDMFVRTGHYAGHRAKLWRTTALLDEVLDAAVTLWTEHKMPKCRPGFVVGWAGNSVPLTAEHIVAICSGMDGTLPNRVHKQQSQQPKQAERWRFFVPPLVIEADQLRRLSVPSQLHLIGAAIEYDGGRLVVSLNHLSKTDPSLGRNYNVFTRLRSDERKMLGWTAYDISAAMQTICLQLIGADESDYPLLTSYATDKAFKRSVRNEISADLNVPVEKVKQQLTAYANGSRTGTDKHHHYKAFQQESDRLRREVLAHVDKHDPALMKMARRQSRKRLPEDIDWHSPAPEDRQAMARAKSSVFFFLWTYHERLIRKAMMKLLPDGIEVHDAVYSKMDVDPERIAAAVFESTGFRVNIDRDGSPAKYGECIKK